MSAPIDPKVRAQIISAIKGGTSIADAAAEHQVRPRTIAKWMRQISTRTQATPTELQKAKKRIEFLERVILDLTLEQKAQTYKS